MLARQAQLNAALDLDKSSLVPEHLLFAFPPYSQSRGEISIQISDGTGAVNEGEIDLATRSWTGKIFENS